MKRYIALILTLVIIGTFTFGYLYVIQKAHHHHVPDPTCPICQQIEKTVERMNSLRWFIPIIFLLAFIHLSMYTIKIKIKKEDILRLTPVSLKVLLLN